MPAVADATPSLPASLRFGRFELQARERRLLADGEPVALGARAFDMLVALAARPGQLVTKSELLDLVWPGLVVEESNLHTQMSTLRKVLGGDVIATVPGRGYRFTAAGASTAAQTPAAAPAPPPAAALPPTGGKLFGRAADLARVDRALSAPGCVTLIGAGGVGKTRLALAIAQRWPGRKVWVDLAPLTEAGQVAGALARALGLTVADADAAPQLARALAGDGVLLILDNAEHLVDACAALVAQVLPAAPALHVLVTTQVALRLAGETVLHLEPLSVDDETRNDDGDALALLADRIVAADHRVRLDEAALPVMRDICRHLDGLPLAIEMAAARVPVLGLATVRDELAQRFALLTKGHRVSAPRHRTLHAALDWSHALLGEAEQQLFAALGVFAGGFTLDLCLALVADDDAARWDLIDRLATLVERSLVAVSPDDPPRYRLLETMRAYALERLDAAGRAQDMRRRHAQVLAAFLPTTQNDTDGIARAVPEMDNVAEAFAWARAHAFELAVRLSTGAALVTTLTPWRAQCHAWMVALEPLVEENAAQLGPDLRARWWVEYGRTALAGLYAWGPEKNRRARAIARESGDPALCFIATVSLARSLYEVTPEMDEACAEVAALMQAHPEWPARMRLIGTGALANAANRRGNHEALLALRLQEMRYARETGNPRFVDTVETNVGFTLTAMKRHDEALGHYMAVVDRVDARNDPNMAWALQGAVESLLALGRVDEAQALLPRAAAAGAAVDMPLHVAALPMVAAARGRLEDAARLIGYARQTFATRAMRLGTLGEALDSVQAQLARTLDAARIAALAAEGASLTDAAAVALACRT